VFTGVALLLDGGDLRAALARVRQAMTRPAR
jgi:hypothetical protein